MADVVIELKNITRTYRAGDIDVQALRGVDLVVERGEFVAIVGASGSGKSTLMAILGCLDHPSSGQYFFEGVDVAGLSEPALAGVRSERLGFVFQSFNLLGRASALENVALPLFYASAGPSRRSERLDRARSSLRLLGLGDREANTPAQLSGGQQQRVAIARALINAPGLLLADEPTGNLDTHTSHEIMETLVALNREQAVTIIVVTHAPDIAAYADRVVTIRDGAIVSDERNPARGAATDMRRVQGGQRRPGSDPLASPTDLASVRRGSQSAFGFMILGAAVQAIARNKLRASLTMLGVFIGVAALIAMVAVGQGANEAVAKQIASLGTNLLVVMPGATTSGGARAGSGSASTLRVTDALAIQHDDPAVVEVSYLNRQTGQIEYANQNWNTTIQGVSPNYPPITNWQIAIGRGITEEDDDNAALAVVIGQTVYHQLFNASENPIGATIMVKGVPMRVVGLLVSKGQSTFGQDQDDLVMIPFTTAERKVLGVAAPTQPQTALDAIYTSAPNPFGLKPRLTGYVNSVYVEAASPDQVQTAVQQVTNTLARLHRIKPGDPNDFSVRNLSQIADVVAGSSQVMALLLATVASISLVVGGIGIMNILLDSVTERTREVGLRMAIGARRMHVLLQFLAEAVLLSATGGLAGIVAGLAASRIISLVAGWPTEVPPVAIAGGFLFSAAVGIFFGYYPARKASRLDPIEALRYE
jgi:macrolide transport system ATP-binding/permease protein